LNGHHDNGRSSIQSTYNRRSAKSHAPSIFTNVSCYRSDATIKRRLPPSTVTVMRATIRLPRGSIVGQPEDRALSDEVRRGVVLVQVRKDWSERVARVQLH